MSRVIPVFIPHLGCTHRCVFCDQNAIAAPQAPSAREVRELIEQALPMAQGGEVAFYGGSFTALTPAMQTEYLSVAGEFVRRGAVRGVRLSTRPDCIDVETLARLREYSVKTIELGAQSMDDVVLRAAGRGHTADDTRRAATLVKQFGFSLVLQVMCGLPGDSRASVCQTARDVAALTPDAVRIYPVCVLRDTPLARMTEEKRYTPLTVEQGVEYAADMLEIFEARAIPAIRIGLNPTDTLSGGAVLAGAYHPALGEMVRSRVLLRSALRQLADCKADSVCLSVPRGALSRLVGQKRCNAQSLAHAYPGVRFAFREEDGQREPLKITAMP